VTSVSYAFEYLVSFFIVGTVLWVLGGILIEFAFVSVQNSVYDLAWLYWYGAPVIFMVFSSFYLWRMIKTWMVTR
jgi:hypothetical protein